MKYKFKLYEVNIFGKKVKDVKLTGRYKVLESEYDREFYQIEFSYIRSVPYYIFLTKKVFTTEFIDEYNILFYPVYKEEIFNCGDSE